MWNGVSAFVTGGGDPRLGLTLIQKAAAGSKQSNREIRIGEDEDYVFHGSYRCTPTAITPRSTQKALKIQGDLIENLSAFL